MARKRYQRSGKRPAKSSAIDVEFDIDEMDSLGQGVSKVPDTDNSVKVTFVAKTLPGEKGTARIMRQSKGVRFAHIKSMSEVAANRTPEVCPHFDRCPACHYLHTDYASEMQYKLLALKRSLHNLPLDPQRIEVIGAKQRLHYRNRLQLHYRHKYLGMVDALTDQVVEIPQCQIIREEMQPSFDALYQDKSWTSHVQAGGHVEIYLVQGKVCTSWDKPYAEGGFTQVNDSMNEVLRGRTTEYLKEQRFDSLLDLFSGHGNLSNPVSDVMGIHRRLIDLSADVDHPDFVRLDLFSPSALKEFSSVEKRKQFDVIVLDPPRKGFPALASWVRQYIPHHLVYVSCSAATLARDLQLLGDAGVKYTIKKTLLIDLFPGTYHFETVCFLSLKWHC